MFHFVQCDMFERFLVVDRFVLHIDGPQNHTRDGWGINIEAWFGLETHKFYTAHVFSQDYGSPVIIHSVKKRGFDVGSKAGGGCSTIMGANPIRPQTGKH